MFSKLTIGLIAAAMSVGSLTAYLQDRGNSNPALKQEKQDKQDKEQDKEQDKKLTRSTFMGRKLESSRDIVAGLALEDFKLISKSAQDLMLLSHEAEWNVLQTPPYLRMSSEFRSSAERLRDSAREKNLDGATLSFFEVTLSCVRCHKYVRDTRKHR